LPGFEDAPLRVDEGYADARELEAVPEIGGIEDATL